jgi:hypothetical protein
MPLKVIPNVSHQKRFISSLEVYVGPPGTAPFPLDAIVFEEDTYQVLNAGNTLYETEEHPVRTITEAFLVKPAKPGTIIVKGSHPLRLLAVVHDLDESPSWREDWIAEALQIIFREVERRNLRTLALPLLGAVHGSYNTPAFIELLRHVLDRTALSSLTRLWLIAPEDAAISAIGAVAALRDDS